MAKENTINEIERFFRDYKKLDFTSDENWRKKTNEIIDNRCMKEDITEDEVLISIICADIRTEYERKLYNAEMRVLADFYNVEYREYYETK